MTNFILIKPQLKPEIIGKAIEKIIPLSKIEKAIQETNCAEKRNRILPTSIIILLVISLNFWSRDSVVDVWKNLVQGLMSHLIPLKLRLITPSSGSLSEARQRVGAGVMVRLFQLICTPLATTKTPGAFLLPDFLDKSIVPVSSCRAKSFVFTTGKTANHSTTSRHSL
jgi:hypothetical protein